MLNLLTKKRIVQTKQKSRISIERGLIDIRTVSTIQITPLFSIKTSNLDSSRDYRINGLEIPELAPVLQPSKQNPFEKVKDSSSRTK